MLRPSDVRPDWPAVLAKGCRAYDAVRERRRRTGLGPLPDEAAALAELLGLLRALVGDCGAADVRELLDQARRWNLKGWQE